MSKTSDEAMKPEGVETLIRALARLSEESLENIVCLVREARAANNEAASVAISKGDSPLHFLAEGAVDEEGLLIAMVGAGDRKMSKDFGCALDDFIERRIALVDAGLEPHGNVRSALHGLVERCIREDSPQALCLVMDADKRYMSARGLEARSVLDVTAECVRKGAARCVGALLPRLEADGLAGDPAQPRKLVAGLADLLNRRFNRAGAMCLQLLDAGVFHRSGHEFDLSGSFGFTLRRLSENFIVNQDGEGFGRFLAYFANEDERKVFDQRREKEVSCVTRAVVLLGEPAVFLGKALDSVDWLPEEASQAFLQIGLERQDAHIVKTLMDADLVSVQSFVKAVGDRVPVRSFAMAEALRLSEGQAGCFFHQAKIDLAGFENVTGAEPDQMIDFLDDLDRWGYRFVVGEGSVVKAAILASSPDSEKLERLGERLHESGFDYLIKQRGWEMVLQIGLEVRDDPSDENLSRAVEAIRFLKEQGAKTFVFRCGEVPEAIERVCLSADEDRPAPGMTR